MSSNDYAVRTYADAFGLWHAKIEAPWESTRDDVAPMARSAIKAELTARESHTSPVRSVSVRLHVTWAAGGRRSWDFVEGVVQ